MIHLPPEFIQRMQGQLGTEADEFLKVLDSPSPTSLRLHHLKGRSSFELNEKVKWCDTGYYLETRPLFYLDPHWHAGAYYVQEASSMILDNVINQLKLDDQPRIWLDVCASPGGKTGILAKHLGPGDVLVANEVVGQRRTILRENLTRAGFLNTFISGEPATSFTEPFADILLIDAPCAGEGMMRKEPEAIRQWSPSLVQSCSLMQKQIVSDAVNALKTNGFLIYSTCSYSMEENLKNIAYFSEKHHLQCVPLSFPDDWGISTLQQGDHVGYQLYPHKVKGEGLFISVLQNTSDEEPKYRKPRKPFNLFEPVPAWMATHLDKPETKRIRKNNPLNQFLTAAAEAKANEVLMNIPRAECLAEAGELKGRDFVPSHFLAMAGTQHENYTVLSLDRSAALDYLERTSTGLPSVKDTGWYVISFEETLLGWAKYTPQGWKNHYPMNWRLRDRNKK
jgi:16S rRNA C967 or C1407 C5-methylase (RsmB/RsmF family)/NOL1/NOP2/fmu family ribosome biogenesis protein